MLNRNTSHPDHDFHERVCQYRAKLILHKGFKQYRETFGDSTSEIAEYLGWTESKLKQFVYTNFYARKTEDIILLCRLFQCDVDEATRPYNGELDCDLAIEVMAMDDEREEEKSNVQPLFPWPEEKCSKRNLTARQKTVAENLRYYWRQKQASERITQTEFSKSLGWSHSIFGQYLNGRVPCGVNAVVKIAEGLGISPAALDPPLRKSFTLPTDDNPVFLSRDNLHELSIQLSDQELCTLVSMRAESLSQSNLLELTKDLMMLGMTRGSQTELPLPDFE